MFWFLIYSDILTNNDTKFYIIIRALGSRYFKVKNHPAKFSESMMMSERQNSPQSGSVALIIIDT